jgi:Mn-containing catalase
MWIYEKKLMYPVKVSGSNPKLAKDIITQYGGPGTFWVTGFNRHYLSLSY